MGISIRHYLFPEDGSLRRVPQRIVEALPHGQDAIPEFAGTRQRIADVVIESMDGRPRRILDARGTYWEFDADGRIDGELIERLIERLDAASSAARGRRATVVDLVPAIKLRELNARDQWTLSADDLDRIAADLWPGINGSAPDVTTVKGKAPKKPRLTFEARSALEDVRKYVDAIRLRLDNLPERTLKSIAFEAHRTALWEDEALWRGVADQAKQREAVRAAHRTGRGEWYAILEVAQSHDTLPYLWEQVTLAHEKCATRKEAVEACRRMMTEKATLMDAGMEVSVNVRSALEWRPEEWE